MLDPPEALPSPAEFLRTQLEARNMTQMDLAFVLGVAQQSISLIASGRRGISGDMAKALAEVFGVPAEYIMKLQKASEVQLELARAKSPDPAIARKAKLISTYPVREMTKRGWIDSDPERIEAQMARFFGGTNIDETPHLAHAAKKSDYADTPPAQIAWFYRVRQIASEMVVPKYSEAKLRGSLDRIRALMTAPEEARHVPKILTECGVRFVIVECLPGAKVDGVCLWLANGTSPVIGMSLRFDRIDNFWFVLGHELEHVLRRHGVDTPIIDAELEGERAGTGEGLPEEERVANAAASDFCVPKAQMDSWIARKQPFFSEKDLIGFAKRLQIHPGIVAGQLRNRMQNYKLFARFLDKIRHAVTPTALVDGWGQIVPVRT